MRAFNGVHTPDIVEMSYFVGKSITLFVGFYCGLQWLYYRDINKSIEDKGKKDKDKNKKATDKKGDQS